MVERRSIDAKELNSVAGRMDGGNGKEEELSDRQDAAK